jgi:hypothetical protein
MAGAGCSGMLLQPAFCVARGFLKEICAAGKNNYIMEMINVEL